MKHKTQGSQLYVFNDTESPVSVLAIAGITNIGGLGGQASKIDTTTLDDLQYRQNISGLIDPGDADLGFLFDFTADGQNFIRDNVGKSFLWAIGYVDQNGNGYGTPPTVNGSEDGFELPTERNWTTFTASISQNLRTFEMDSVVKMTSALRLSGGLTDIPAST